MRRTSWLDSGTAILAVVGVIVSILSHNWAAMCWAIVAALSSYRLSIGLPSSGCGDATKHS
jgi:hypothetical protein